MLSITYDAKALQDGIGAQVQRIIGIFAIAKFFRIGYVHTEIEEILIHRGDRVQTIEQYQCLLDQVNGMVKFESNVRNQPSEEIHIRNLNVRNFFSFFIKYRFSKRSVLLKVLLPDQLLNRIPLVISQFRKMNRSLGNEVSERIGVHVRQSGNVRDFVVAGDIKTRQLYEEYYLNALKEIFLKFSKKNLADMELVIFTDETSHPTTFKPFEGQTQMWKEAGYAFDESQILFEPMRIAESIQEVYPHAQIVRGGNPVLVIEMLSRSKVIVMSRSSFSITAALLSSTRDIYYPEDYWYPRILKHISRR